jgi:hypothetical protein
MRREGLANAPRSTSGGGDGGCGGAFLDLFGINASPKHVLQPSARHFEHVEAPVAVLLSSLHCDVQVPLCELRGLIIIIR